MILDPKDRLIPALDVEIADEAARLAAELSPVVSTFKIGLRLFVRNGPAIVRRIADGGGRIFLDLKLHDIPDQVEAACRGAADLGIDLLTVHASGGAEMMRAAVKGAGGRLRLLAVTVLTSLDEAATARLFGRGMTVEERSAAWAREAVEAGADGVVASPQEAATLRAVLPPDALIVTPGIRGAGEATGDQARHASAAAAIRAGASHLVVGRPILRAPDPAATARALIEEIRAALA
jgi:orotidine-5'-phosphate decarboxylase